MRLTTRNLENICFFLNKYLKENMNSQMVQCSVLHKERIEANEMFQSSPTPQHMRDDIIEHHTQYYLPQLLSTQNYLMEATI